MDARRFDDRNSRESNLRNLALVMGGLLILLVGAVIFLIFSFGSRPSPISAVPSVTPTASSSASLAPALSPASSLLPSPSGIPATAVPPTATPLPSVSPTATPTPTATPRTPLVGDEPSDALAIGLLPYSQSLDVRRATEGSSDRRCSDERESNDTVWFKYTATSDADLGAYTAGSDYGTVLVVNRLNADGTSEMVGCNLWSPQDGSAVRVSPQIGATYLFMVGSTSRRSGELNFALDYAPKPASFEAILSPYGGFNSFGTVELSMTTICKGDIVDASVDIELRQVVDRQVHTMYGYWDFSGCRHEQQWTLTLSSDDYVFGSEPTTAYVSLSYSDRFDSHWSSSTTEVALHQTGGPSPTPFLPSPSPSL